MGDPYHAPTWTDAQSLFDAVARHLLKQDAKSKNAYGVCVPRSPQGLRSAEGCLLDDEELDGGFRGFRFQPGDIVLLPRMQPHRQLLADLCFVHDSCAVADWFQMLGQVAQQHNLAYLAT